jgi:hypothetical protein
MRLLVCRPIGPGIRRAPRLRFESVPCGGARLPRYREETQRYPRSRASAAHPALFAIGRFSQLLTVAARLRMPRVCSHLLLPGTGFPRPVKHPYPGRFRHKL